MLKNRYVISEKNVEYIWALGIKKILRFLFLWTTKLAEQLILSDGFLLFLLLFLFYFLLHFFSAFNVLKTEMKVINLRMMISYLVKLITVISWVWYNSKVKLSGSTEEGRVIQRKVRHTSPVLDSSLFCDGTLRKITEYLIFKLLTFKMKTTVTTLHC